LDEDPVALVAEVVVALLVVELSAVEAVEVL
jgi:hypothetical protein